MSQALRPNHSASGLNDELAISAMAQALRGLSDYDLADRRTRADIYLDSKIPLNDMYEHDSRAVHVECLRRKWAFR